MYIYSGIQLIFSHVNYYLNQISTWFHNLNWAQVIELLPSPYVAFVSGILVILLAMASVGLIKKLSFFMG